MREIKFRAWDKVDKKVRKVMSLDFYNTRQSEVTLASDGDVYLRFFEQVELMQSTGLKDKNGVEVFEGDVIIDHLLNDKNGEYFAVVKCDNYFYPKMIRYGVICNNIIDPMMFNQHTRLNGVEVVGNIYENKELLND